MYLAVILDVFSRAVVGWSLADHLRGELVEVRRPGIRVPVRTERRTDVLRRDPQDVGRCVGRSGLIARLTSREQNEKQAEEGE